MEQVNLDECCKLTVSTADDGMPSWANLETTSVASKLYGRFAGPGIYACFWKGGLIYIGSHAPSGKHVADRAHKHIVGFTLRSRKLFFGSENKLVKYLTDTPDHAMTKDLQTAIGSSRRLLTEGRKAGSINSSARKAAFAATEWNEVKNASPEELLSHFSFYYQSVRNEGTPMTSYHLVQNIEKPLIEIFNPVCNTDYSEGNGARVSVEEVRAVLDEQIARAGASSLDLPKETHSLEITKRMRGVSGPLIVPLDDRWDYYKTQGGQERVRTTADTRSTLLVRKSAATLHCLAMPEQLTRVGIEAEPAKDAVMNAKVAIAGLTPTQLHCLLELSLRMTD